MAVELLEEACFGEETKERMFLDRLGSLPQLPPLPTASTLERAPPRGMPLDVLAQIYTGQFKHSVWAEYLA